MQLRSDLFGGAREWTRRFAMATALGVFFGLIGPFDTYSRTTLAERMIFWIGLLWLGAILFSLTVGPAIRFGARLGFHRVFSALAATVLASIPLAAATALVAASEWSARQPPLAWYGETLMVAVPVMLVNMIWLRSWLSPTAASAPQAAPSSEPLAGVFLRRLPPELGRELLCLQMEDHYVRAHTPKGSALILIPLRQAIAELGDTPGLQVHRSWWVARAAVERPVSDGRNLKLRLVGGLEAPVARSSVSDVRTAGWLD